MAREVHSTGEGGLKRDAAGGADHGESEAGSVETRDARGSKPPGVTAFPWSKDLSVVLMTWQDSHWCGARSWFRW